MMKLESDKTWVIYHPLLKGNATGLNGVCEKDEWDELELRKPGCQVLVVSGIASEGAAERMARGTSGDSIRRAK